MISVTYFYKMNLSQIVYPMIIYPTFLMDVLLWKVIDESKHNDQQ